MLVKDVIGECLIKMDGLSFIENEIYTEAQQAQIDRLLGALNIAYREIVTQYLPLIYEQEIEFVGGEFDYDNLVKPMLYPVKAETDGVKIKIKTGIGKLKSDFSGKAVLCYAYLPEALILTDTIDNIRLTKGVLSDAALAEYYFEDRVFELAASFDEKFRSVLSALRYKGKELRVKAPGWQA